MKYLILLLFTFNAYANIKIEIENTENGRKFGAVFDTQMEADLWKSKNIANNSWGKPDRWELKKQGETCPGAERTSGDVESGFYNECFYPVEYTITETDITAEVQAKKDAKAARKTEIQQIKAAINVIDNSDLPNWHKKILKRLVKELK